MSKVNFVMIVLNGADFIKQSIESVYDIASKIIIAEGAVKGEDEKHRDEKNNVDNYIDYKICRYSDKNGLSTDGTGDIINSIKDPQHKIVYKKIGFVKNKTELSNICIKEVEQNCDYVWMLDSDEVYEEWVLKDVIKYLDANKDVNCVDLETWSFFRDIRHVGSKSIWRLGFRRVFRYKKGSFWKNHAPPNFMWPDNDKPIHELGRVIDVEESKRRGWCLYHYSYVTEKQVTERFEHFYIKIYKPNWVNRVWKRCFEEGVIKKYGSHPFNESRLFYDEKAFDENKIELGAIDTFFRNHPQAMESHPLFKESYPTKGLRVVHVINSWGMGGGSQSTLYTCVESHKKYSDTHEYIAYVPGVKPEFSGLNIFTINDDVDKIVNYINNKKFDILHVEWWGDNREKSLDICKKVNLPTVATFHINPSEGRFHLHDDDIKAYDAFLLSTEKMLNNEYIKKIDASKKIIRCINSPGDYWRLVDSWKDKVKHDKFIGAINLARGPGKFRANTLEICGKLLDKYKNLYLYFIGIFDKSDEFGKPIIEWSKKYENRGDFLGFYDIKELFKVTDIVLHILPTKSYATSECFLQETMLSKIPCIRIGGDDVSVEVTNELACYDEETFYKNFDIVYKNDSMVSKMIENDYNRVRENCNPIKTAEIVREVYLKLIAAKQNG